MASPAGPLEGVRILDLTRLQPGNYATALLGDLGADVIKVEEPSRGDYVRWTPPLVGEMSAMHLVLNRNKRSVTLNLKQPAGVDLLLQLVEKADALVESFRPGVMGRLGVGYERLARVNPGLVYVAITGYGQDGPYRNRAGHDINYLATAGVLDTTGAGDGPPVLPSVQIADLSGAMMGVAGLLAALWRRQRTGEGDFVDVSMMDSALSWLALHLAPWFAGAEPLRRGEGYLNGGSPFYRVYECGDGRYLSVGALEPQFWESLCAALGHEELASEQFAPPPRMAEIHEILERVFLEKTSEQWMERFEGLDVCVAPVNDFEAMAADPQVKARGMLSTQQVPGVGLWRQLGVPVALKIAPGSLRSPAPRLGEHNEEVYLEAGIEGSRLSELKAQGIV